MATRSIAGQRPRAAQNVGLDNLGALLGEPRERCPFPAKLEVTHSVAENPTTDAPKLEVTRVVGEKPAAASGANREDTNSVSEKPASGQPNSEDAPAVSEKVQARARRLVSRIVEREAIFRRQGSVVASWKTYRGKRLGPYYRLVYREEGRQRSIYLGTCVQLAERVRGLLARLQGFRDEHRRYRRWNREIRRVQFHHKRAIRKILATVGLELKGWEFRGVRRMFQTLRETGEDALNARFEAYFREHRMPPILAAFLGSPDGRIPMTCQT